MLPADHVVTDEEAFARAVSVAVAQAEQGYLVTFGIVPTHPATGYGYIRTGETHQPLGTGGGPLRGEAEAGGGLPLPALRRLPVEQRHVRVLLHGAHRGAGPPLSRRPRRLPEGPGRGGAAQRPHPPRRGRLRLGPVDLRRLRGHGADRPGGGGGPRRRMERRGRLGGAVGPGGPRRRRQRHRRRRHGPRGAPLPAAGLEPPGGGDRPRRRGGGGDRRRRAGGGPRPRPGGQDPGGAPAGGGAARVRIRRHRLAHLGHFGHPAPRRGHHGAPGDRWTRGTRPPSAPPPTCTAS